MLHNISKPNFSYKGDDVIEFVVFLDIYGVLNTSIKCQVTMLEYPEVGDKRVKLIATAMKEIREKSFVSLKYCRLKIT